LPDVKEEVTMGEDDKAETTDKERDAIGGFFSSARHRPESPSTTGSEATDGREAKDLPGPPGDIDTSAQVAHEDYDASDDVPDADAADQMTAAEAAGQVAYGSGDTDGSITPTGVESSSG
jgi:hypothetical protein